MNLIHQAYQGFIIPVISTLNNSLFLFLLLTINLFILNGSLLIHLKINLLSQVFHVWIYMFLNKQFQNKQVINLTSKFSLTVLLEF